ncbi:MAG: tRNA (adenosine(37)-N6)-threonylcarbamoyltransferase complex ATPase subunit type 1 TsaE [Candidatus Methylacidiphilales bacterium]
MILESSSDAETEAFAASCASFIQTGDTLLLVGGLGAGKTCFVRGLVLALGGDPDEVSSPTFALVHPYTLQDGVLHHWDLYRLKDNTDWSVLDLDDHLADSHSTTVIEWPERYPSWASLPAHRLTIETLGENRRRLHFQHH